MIIITIRLVLIALNVFKTTFIEPISVRKQNYCIHSLKAGIFNSFDSVKIFKKTGRQVLYFKTLKKIVVYNLKQNRMVFWDYFYR